MCTDGDAAGQTYKVDDYTNTSAQGTPLTVTQGYERAADEIAVRFATEAILDGTYDAVRNNYCKSSGTLLDLT